MHFLVTTGGYLSNYDRGLSTNPKMQVDTHDLGQIQEWHEWSVSITLRHWPEEFIVAILRSFPVWAD
jgi:hypothetical protein